MMTIDPHLLLAQHYTTPSNGARDLAGRVGAAHRRWVAIVVFGGNPTRTLYGVELYRRSLASELWHTGYARIEAQDTAMVIGHGVPRQSFRFLATTSTWSDGHEIVATIRER